MSRKNKHIKSVVVGLKPFNFAPGEHIYGPAGLYVINGKPEKTAHGADVLPVTLLKALGDGSFEWAEIPYKWAEGTQFQIFLGDRGVPGYAYDDRPCTLARSWPMAKAADKAYWVWWARDWKPRFDDVYGF